MPSTDALNLVAIANKKKNKIRNRFTARVVFAQRKIFKLHTASVIFIVIKLSPDSLLLFAADECIWMMMMMLLLLLLIFTTGIPVCMCVCVLLLCSFETHLRFKSVEQQKDVRNHLADSTDRSVIVLFYAHSNGHIHYHDGNLSHTHTHTYVYILPKPL